MTSRIEDTIRACLANGRRILDEDVSFCEFNDPPATAYFLTMIAQEEFAKGFLLALASRDVIPFDRHVLRATRDHTCKQLLGMVMDHLQPDDEKWEQRIFSPLQATARQFPQRVADAISIFRFEKIGRWESSHWDYVQPPAYDRDACSIAEGRQDRRKQDALYVRVANDGGVASVPAATRAEVRREIGRADRFERCVLSVLDGEPWGFDDDAVREVFRKAFQTALA